MVKVRFYDISTGDKEVSNTSIISQYRGACVPLNTEVIVNSADGDSYVYSKDRVLQYKVTHDQVHVTPYRSMSLKVNLAW